MKKYDICGIGNALLDLEFEVTDETLQRANIRKGVMTLIDADRERVLLEELDGIKHIKACGGSAANTVTIARQLGADVFYCCKIANDAAGDFYYNDLTSKGIQTNLSTIAREPGVTGKCLALITPDTDRTMNTYLGITEAFSVNEIDEQAIAESNYLYIEGYLVASKTAYAAALHAAKIARANNTKIALTLADPNMVTYFKDELLNIIGDGIDLLFSNEHEATMFTDSFDLAGAKEKLKKYAKQFAITCSENGSWIYDGHRMFHVAAYQVTAVDSTGAGDVYAGSFLYSIAKNYNFQVAADIASLSASKVVSKFGPRLDEHEIANIREHMEKYNSM